ncbi:WD repeat-containing protein WRAP73 [Notothenia coriiceps]|uniref:WD repeat-containing protein WRAP73 n=1 Tax=Notothenia coriiceps TaxID=8208 RepID=A0A6I9NFD3_9TELE|nr:PREDICTED: WD repeat-containing protein WRAP73 [Notothenia coriiceps]
MNFSEVFKQSNQLCKVSPDGKCLATCVQYRLVVRDVGTLQILQLYTCLDQISHMDWSSDSLFILCAMYKRGLVQVWSLEQPDWHCKIDEGSIGLVSSRWSPDGRHILNTTEFHVSVKLVRAWVRAFMPTEVCLYICLSGFNCCWLARKGDLKIARHQSLKYLWNMGAMCMSPSNVFKANSSPPDSYPTLPAHSHWETTPTLPGPESQSQNAVTVKVRILNHITWKKITQFEHPAAINNTKAVVYKEVVKRPAVCSDDLSLHNITIGNTLFNTQSKYEICPTPVQLPVVKPDPDRANPKIGVSTLAFSSDSRYLATKNDNMASVVWVWDVQKMSLVAVLEQTAAVRCFQWDPRRPRLALCTGNTKLYLWSPAGCVSVQVPTEGGFQVQSLKWHCSGDSLILLGKEQLCLCYMDNDQEDK